MSDAASGLALGITRSIAGQPWHWRRASADMRDEGGSENLAPDDLVTQLLLARGVTRGDLDRQRTPTLRGFMPDPSLFRDMRSEEHTSELQSLMRISYAVFCLNKQRQT